MAGALAERVFVDKLDNVGFTGVTVFDRTPWSVDDLVQVPLFTPDLIQLMRDLVPREQQAEVAMSVTATAHKPA